MGDIMDISKYTGHIATGLVCAGVTFGACWFVMDYSRRDVIDLGEKMKVVDECVDYMEKANYPFADNDPVEGAIQGYVSALADDKYTSYYEDVSDVEFMVTYVNTAGTAIASGFQIGAADDGNILMTEIKSGLAADKQGLKVGDVITAIDGVSVKEKGFENIANKMLGKQDTEVTFTVRRENKEFDLLFKRDHIYVNSVYFEVKGDVGIIDIDGIEQMAEGQLDEAIKGTESCSKLIIDLRNNPGGDVEAAAYMAAQIGGYCKITCTKNNGETEIIERKMESECADKKAVILFNEKTASSAEIMSAALMQSLDATAVGTNTFGKGIFQENVTLSNGGHLRYTLGTYTVGDWECYHGVGIEPDVEVEMDPSFIGTDDDIQLQKALELLN